MFIVQQQTTEQLTNSSAHNVGFTDTNTSGAITGTIDYISSVIVQCVSYQRSVQKLGNSIRIMSVVLVKSYGTVRSRRTRNTLC